MKSKPRIGLVSIGGKPLAHPISARLKVYRDPDLCPYCRRESTEFYLFDDHGRRQIGKVMLTYGGCCTDCAATEDEVHHA